jgi:hypothetical protein
MARNDMRLDSYQDPRGGNVSNDMTLGSSKRPVDSKTKVPGVQRIGDSYSASTSQLNQGGEGGGNVNIGNASGQANQEVKVNPTRTVGSTLNEVKDVVSNGVPNDVSNIGDTISGISDAVKDNNNSKGLFPTMGEGFRSMADSYIEGGTKFNNRIASALPSPDVSSRFLFGPNSTKVSDIISNVNNTLSSSLGSSSSSNGTISPEERQRQLTGTGQTDKGRVGNIIPESANGTMGNGQFTTPSGGTATVTRGDGTPAFSQSQQSSLQHTLNRNADPAVQAELAQQAAIVNDRIKQTRLGDERRAGRSLSPRAEYDAALSSGNIARIMHAEDIYKTRLGVDSKNNAEGLANQRFQYEQDRDQQRANATALGEKHKSRAEGLRSYYSALSDNEKAMGTPAQKYQIAKSHFGTVTSEHLPNILGSSHEAYSKLTNQKDQADFLARAGITL